MAFESSTEMEARSSAQMPQSGEAGEEGRLVSGVLAKDRKATAKFVANCADWIYPFVHRRLIPRAELVEDLTQEILFAAWQALPNFRGDGSLRSWVMGIARHKLEDYYRKKIREMEISEEDESPMEQTIAPGLDQHLDSTTRRERVQKTLALLPEPYALALIWKYRDEKSVREMAKLTGKTEKAMERLLARARKDFKRRWSDVRV